MKACWHARTVAAWLALLALTAAHPAPAEAQTGVNDFLTWWNQNVAGPLNTDFAAALGVEENTDPATAILMADAAAGGVITIGAAYEAGGAEALKLIYDGYTTYKVGRYGADAGDAINQGDIPRVLDDFFGAAIQIGLSYGFSDPSVEATISGLVEEVSVDATLDALDEIVTDGQGYFEYQTPPETMDHFNQELMSQCNECVPPDPVSLEPPDSSSTDGEQP